MSSMSTRRPRRDQMSISVTAEVDVDDVLSEAGDGQIKAEYLSRFPDASGAPSFDLVEEIRTELIGGRVNAALALCESHLLACRVTDDQRQQQYQNAQRAH